MHAIGARAFFTTNCHSLVVHANPSMIVGLVSLPAELLLYTDGAPTDPCNTGDLACRYVGTYTEGAGPFDPDVVIVLDLPLARDRVLHVERLLRARCSGLSSRGVFTALFISIC